MKFQFLGNFCLKFTQPIFQGIKPFELAQAILTIFVILFIYLLFLFYRSWNWIKSLFFFIILSIGSDYNFQKSIFNLIFVT